jgi:hypothetical protein
MLLLLLLDGPSLAIAMLPLVLRDVLLIIANNSASSFGDNNRHIIAAFAGY